MARNKLLLRLCVCTELASRRRKSCSGLYLLESESKVSRNEIRENTVILEIACGSRCLWDESSLPKHDGFYQCYAAPVIWKSAISARSG